VAEIQTVPEQLASQFVVGCSTATALTRFGLASIRHHTTHTHTHTTHTAQIVSDLVMQT
jgi:hypothetical protein